MVRGSKSGIRNRWYSGEKFTAEKFRTKKYSCFQGLSLN